MLLKRGDKGNDVRNLQRGLNKLGAMLLVDGDFGGSTEAAVADARVVLNLPGLPEADDALLNALVQADELSPELTGPGVTFIGREEVSSPAAYRQRFRHPVWPTADSGITIGIGYDLRFVNETKLEADWGKALPAGTLARLVPVLGTAGSNDLLGTVADVDIPLPAAIVVFLTRMMPEHIGKTRTVYPELDGLPPARRTALISLVFNRGASLDGDRRREMKQIQDLLEAGDLDAVADQFEKMQRLWDPVKERGIVERRQRETILWRDGFAPLLLV